MEVIIYLETHNPDIDLSNYVCICVYHSQSRGAIRFTHTCQERYHHVSRQELNITPNEDVISGFNEKHLRENKRIRLGWVLVV